MNPFPTRRASNSRAVIIIDGLLADTFRTGLRVQSGGPGFRAHNHSIYLIPI